MVRLSRRASGHLHDPPLEALVLVAELGELLVALDVPLGVLSLGLEQGPPALGALLHQGPLQLPLVSAQGLPLRAGDVLQEARVLDGLDELGNVVPGVHQALERGGGVRLVEDGGAVRPLSLSFVLSGLGSGDLSEDRWRWF